MKPYALAAGAAVTILLAACSSTSTPAGTASSAGATTAAPTGSSAAGGIVISSFAYSGTMKVKPGEKVTVTNQDAVVHTLTDKVNHLFDTGNIGGSGGTGTFTAPSKPGSYPFGCTYHPNMKGTLIVAG